MVNFKLKEAINYCWLISSVLQMCATQLLRFSFGYWLVLNNRKQNLLKVICEVIVNRYELFSHLELRYRFHSLFTSSPLFFFIGITCKNGTMVDLHKRIFNDYVKESRPVLNQSTVTNVTIRISFRNLLTLASLIRISYFLFNDQWSNLLLLRVFIDLFGMIFSICVLHSIIFIRLCLYFANSCAFIKTIITAHHSFEVILGNRRWLFAPRYFTEGAQLPWKNTEVQNIHKRIHTMTETKLVQSYYCPDKGTTS